MTELKVFALKNCDTCKKALAWLSSQDVPFNVVDVLADGLSSKDVSNIVEKLGWQQAVNRRSTTWRNLKDADKADLDNARAKPLILAYPTLMRRPVFVHDNAIIAGFDAKARDQLESLL